MMSTANTRKQQRRDDEVGIDHRFQEVFVAAAEDEAVVIKDAQPSSRVSSLLSRRNNTILVVLAMVVLVGITTLSQQKSTTMTTTAVSMTADKAAASSSSGLAALGDGVAAMAVATTVENITTTQQNQHCISTEEELRDMIQSTNHVMIMMEEKAAGTSLKQFARLCNKASGIPSYDQLGERFVNFIPMNQGNIQEKFLTNSYQPPNVVATHLKLPTTLPYLVQNVPPSTLLIYSHRQETSRILSAIEHVMDAFCDPNKRRNTTPKDIFFKPSKKQEQEILRNNDDYTSTRICHVKEENLINMVIKKKLHEIESGSYKLLNCDVYDNIVDYQYYTNTKMVFMDYKYVDLLQTSVAKKYCPKLLSSDDNESDSIDTLDSKNNPTTRSLQVHANVASRKKKTMIYVHTKNKIRKGKRTMNNNEVDDTDEDEEDTNNMLVVTLHDWLQTKSSTLEWSLHLNDIYFDNAKSKACISTTRQLEEDLATCKYGMIKATAIKHHK